MSRPPRGQDIRGVLRPHDGQARFGDIACAVPGGTGEIGDDRLVAALAQAAIGDHPAVRRLLDLATARLAASPQPGV